VQKKYLSSKKELVEVASYITRIFDIAKVKLYASAIKLKFGKLGKLVGKPK